MKRLGIDTGGTFTDFVWLDKEGRVQIHKQLSSPHDPAEAVLAGVAQLAPPADAAVVHGSTVATNALLERRGARTALITTEGFGDLLVIGRQNRPDLYALVPQKPPPLIPRQRRFEVRERVAADGEVLIPLQLEDLAPILAAIAAEDIESVAVCLLFSFLRPEHERQIGRQLQAWASERAVAGRLHISLSSEILPEYREYERTAATAINAYVAPLMARYLTRLAAGLGERPLTIMQSNGGIISAAMAGEQAARTVLSGPAGGVVGARFAAKAGGFNQIITFDMGGTSADVALCPGRLPTASEGEIAGLPLRLPMIDIHTVGAGGGSLAYVDPGGALQVGPQSAGADPGPACYGRAAPPWPATVTDANLVLGRLDAAHFLGGEMRLVEPAARQALTDLARQMGVDSPEMAAWGVLEVINAVMERAIRRISVERGYDPRDFTLVAFGGAGPLHASDLAGRLGIRQILIPTIPGVLSALGMLTAAPTRDYSQTVMVALERDQAGPAKELEAAFPPLVTRARQEMAQQGYQPDRLLLHYGLDARYKGQSHELTIAYGPGKNGRSIEQRFHQAHEKRYGYALPDEQVEAVNARLTAIAPVAAPELPRQRPGPAAADAAIVGQKEVWFGRRPQLAPLYKRTRLRAGHRFSGPAVVFQYDTTTVIPPGWNAIVDEYGNLVIEQ